MIVDKILEALEDNLIPHSELVNIACEGNLEQNCTVCQKEITVTRMWYLGSGLGDLKEDSAQMPVTASGCLDPLEGVVFDCGSLECSRERFSSFRIWSDVVTSTVTKLIPTRCDFCFLCAPLQEVHRSLCKTKNYCSKICRRADNDVHKVCCEQGQQVEERKIKTNKGGLQSVIPP